MTRRHKQKEVAMSDNTSLIRQAYYRGKEPPPPVQHSATPPVAAPPTNAVDRMRSIRDAVKGGAYTAARSALTDAERAVS